MSDFDPEDDDLSGLDEFTVGKKVQISLADMDLPSWKHDLAADLLLIKNLIASMDKVKPADDAKLQHLLAQIKVKVDEPLNPNNRKVLIFTAFADTAQLPLRQSCALCAATRAARRQSHGVRRAQDHT